MKTDDPIEAYINTINPEVIRYMKVIVPYIPHIIWGIKELHKWQEGEETYQKLFSFLENAYISPGDINQFKAEGLKAGGSSQEDSAAAKALSSLVHHFFRRRRREEFLKESCGVVDVNENICSVGGPVSHMHTRLSMGYPEDLSQYSLESSIDVPFPYIFNVDTSSLNYPELKVKVLAKERKYWEEPNWCIIDRKSKKSPFGMPEVDVRSKLLKTDFLILTVMPNNLSKKAERAGKKHLVAAGTHGIANRALGGVLKDPKVIKEINTQRRGSEFFQTVIKITKIKHKKSESLPVEWAHLITVPF